MKVFIVIAFIFIGHIVTGQTLQGKASYYASKFEGRKTALGTRFSNKGNTCACNKLKLGSYVKVTNLKNKKTAVLLVNDRLAAHSKRLIDVTQKVAKDLGFYSNGLCTVSVTVVHKDSIANKD
jgi:rare lipoprotein A